MENQERCFYKIAHITVANCEIKEMQCGFLLGCGTTDAIFIIRQLQEKHLIANKTLYMAFVYLEKKAFNCVHQGFIWLAMPRLEQKSG